MRTTINLDEQLLAAAQRATGVTERSALIHEGLKGADRAGKRETAGAAWGYATATGTGTAPPDGFRMILVDTSVWIDYFRRGEPVLASALEASEVMMHPFILGELACGNLKRRARCSG